MKAITAIAGRDLKSGLFSLRGAAIFFFFTIILGAFFQSFIYTFLEMQQQGPMMGGEAPTLDQLITAVFNNLHFVLLMALPAVTMASFADEKQTKVFRLLQTAPLSSASIVLGKFLGCVLLMGLVLASSLAFIGFTTAYGNPDLGLVLSSYLGIMLLICSHLAFGLWVSSLTSHQFIAFIFTMAGLFFMLILNWIAPHISSSEGVEGFVKYLASTSHLEPFLRGLISVGDVSYFVLVTVFFLFLSTVAVDAERWR